MPDFKNFAIDCMDRFSFPALGSDSWEIGSQLMENLGADAITLGAIAPHSMEPTWARSSMDISFLKQYVEEDLFSFDPFVKDLASNMSPVVVIPGDPARGQVDANRRQDLNQRLHDYGYRFLYGVKSGGPKEGEIKILTFCSNLGPKEFDAELMTQIRLAALIMMSHTGAPREFADDFISQSRVKPLTPRENEVLRLYALGYRNDRITAEMNISEIMVRKHAASARKKLGAKTRDQTLMLALKHRLIDI